ncbi:MAG TPA: tetratricopeptide repeat protein [Planctomycetaceae bacterium]|nr:tetratricopeptide repeat protein [Planctomycetaceae bacterium]HIQ22033.1 tetratricopeptide repeat protein [Planctomycetota bacterium]
MALDLAQIVRVAKRLQQAHGYLELGMTEQALQRLEGLDQLGPLEGEAAWLRAEAFRMQHRYDDAALWFRTAAQKFPPPFDRSAWYALSLCYRQTGDLTRAINTLARARGAGLPRPKRL